MTRERLALQQIEHICSKYPETHLALAAMLAEVNREARIGLGKEPRWRTQWEGRGR